MIRLALVVLAGLMMPAAYADIQGKVQDTTPALGAISPAAGPVEPTLLDIKAEQLKDSAVKSGVDVDDADLTDEDATQVAPVPVHNTSSWTSSGRNVSGSGLKVLSNDDAAAYKDAFAQARRGVSPNPKVQDKVLMGEVRGQYLLNKNGATFNELNSWLKDYRDLPMAAEVYDKADAKRERPRQVCHMESVTQKITTKHKNKDGSKKTVIKKTKKRTCTMVGEWGPAPVVPAAVERREMLKARREALRADELGKLSAEGRRIIGQSWKLRGQGKYGEATNLLLAPGSRAEAGNEMWQGELTKIADYYHGQRDWKALLKAAKPAGDVRGPTRDDARWLAGYAYYLMDNKQDAAEQWELLVQNEPVGGRHFARAAWWGARAFNELGQAGRAKTLLNAGAADSISFYGQLCAAKLGKTKTLDWSAPSVFENDFTQLQKVPAAKRGLALAQLGEISMAQRQLRAANEDLPYNATRALAASAVRLGLPATALYAGKQLKEQGDIMPAALFPLAEDWSPNGGWKYDRALMLGIMRQESAFNPQIGSRVGAQGLMQIMPATGNYIARLTGQPLPARADLHDPGTNLMLAQSYLKYLSDKLDGNQMMVVAAYNGGIGNVQRWMASGRTPGHDPVLWLESIPFDETRDYVEKVFGNYWLYQQRLNQTPWSLNALADGYWPLQWSSKVAKN